MRRAQPYTKQKTAHPYPVRFHAVDLAGLDLLKSALGEASRPAVLRRLIREAVAKIEQGVANER